MDEMNLLDMLTSARDNLKRTRDDVAKAKQDVLANETGLTKKLRSEFLKLREILYETETRVLDETKNEYKQKLTELETVEGEITKKIQLLSQLQFTEAVKIPIPDVNVDIDLVDFETAAEKIKAIKILRRTQSKESTPCKSPSKTGSSASVKLDLVPLNTQTSTTSKRGVSANDEASVTTAKKKKKQATGAAAAKRQRIIDTDDSVESESDQDLLVAAKGEVSVVDDDEDIDAGETSSAAGEKLLIRSNVRDFIKCSKCYKPRCIYARKALSAEQSQEISQWKEKVRRFYKCGDKLPSLLRFSSDSVGIEEQVDCHCDIDIHYFYPPRKFPLVCYTCGSDNVTRLSEEERKNYSTYNPVCFRCSAEGQEPRTKKKYVRNNSTKRPNND